MPENPELSAKLTRPQLALLDKFLEVCVTRGIDRIEFQDGTWIPRSVTFRDQPVAPLAAQQREMTSADQMEIQKSIAADIRRVRGGQPLQGWEDPDDGTGDLDRAHGLLVHSSVGPAG